MAKADTVLFALDFFQQFQGFYKVLRVLKQSEIDIEIDIVAQYLCSGQSNSHISHYLYSSPTQGQDISQSFAAHRVIFNLKQHSEPSSYKCYL